MMSLLITETSFMEAPEVYSVHKVWIACYRHRYGSGMLENNHNFVAQVYTSYETKGHFLAFNYIFWFFILFLGLLFHFIFIFSGTDRECLKIIWWLESTLRMKQKAIFWPFIPSLTVTFIYWPMSTHPPQLRYTNILVKPSKDFFCSFNCSVKIILM